MSAARVAIYALFFLAIFFGLIYARFGNDAPSILMSLLSSPFQQPLTPASYGPSNHQQPASNSSSGMHPLLFPNMRWAGMPVKIFVDNSSCTDDIYTRLALAAADWQSATNGTVAFSFVPDAADGKVNVQCDRQLPTQDQGQMIVETLGETRPQVINTGLYNLTVSAEVSIQLHQFTCHEPIVFIHELGHVLGLAHDNDTDSVMFAYEHCDQKITPDTVSTLEQLYSSPALPDLYLTDVNATTHGVYADFNLTVLNQGLIDSPTTTAVITDGSTQIYSFDVPILKPGSGWYFTVTNVLVQTGFKNATVTVDPANELQELSKSNNAVHLVRQ